MPSLEAYRAHAYATSMQKCPIPLKVDLDIRIKAYQAQLLNVMQEHMGAILSNGVYDMACENNIWVLHYLSVCMICHPNFLETCVHGSTIVHGLLSVMNNDHD